MNKNKYRKRVYDCSYTRFRVCGCQKKPGMLKMGENIGYKWINK